MNISNDGIMSNHDEQVKLNIEELKKPELEQIMFSPAPELIRADVHTHSTKNLTKRDRMRTTTD
ncbi:hypothetical protein [Dendrosporobacter sp. 1207_IL3150]|uniref:hypothetical protein n=1 Tax=Dendrosporobacter sp. 1207_IL3150 TaxID=3084054 RepID=UPI002FD9FEF3